MPDDDPFPGTTRARSDKALKRVRRDPVLGELDDEYVEAWDRFPIVIQTRDGERRECFRIGALAKAWDGRTPQSIYKLEHNGMLPKASYRKKATRGKHKGDRLYTREQIELIIEVAKECGVYRRNTRKRIDTSGFAEALLARWEK